MSVVSDVCVSSYSESCPETSFSPFSTPERLRVPTFARKRIGQANLKPLETEKLLWFCDEILKMGGLKPPGAPVNVLYFRALLSMKGSELIDQLVNLGIIEISLEYSAGNNARHYRFTQFGEVRVTKCNLTIPKLIRNRGDRRRFARARLKAAQQPMKLLEDVEKFIPTKAFKPAMEAYLKDVTERGKSTASMESLRDLILNGGCRFSIKHGRMTPHLVGLPEHLRSCFTVNDEPVVELDQPNSHPSFLPMIFSPFDDATQEDIAEHVRFVQFVQGGKFYEEFEGCWEKDRHVFVDYIGKGESKNDFLAQTPRKGIKKCWQVLFNGKTNPTRLFGTQTWKKFTALFPRIACRMAQYKRAKPRALGDELRKREAAMVADVVSKLSSPCLTLYDGWMCGESAADELIELCRAETLKHLGFVHLPVRK